MKNVQHFIWDFDGTLFDTYPIIIKDLRCALREFGRDCDPVECMQLMLTNIPTARNHYADTYGIDRDELLAAYERHRKQSIELLEAQPMAGVEKVLAKICDSGRYNYIFTHSKESVIRRYLDQHGLSGYFREILGSESPYFALKPAPDAVLHLMTKYGMDAKSAAMVGDRDCDLGSARNANIGTVHYVCAAVPETLCCDWRVESFDEMCALL